MCCRWRRHGGQNLHAHLIHHRQLPWGICSYCVSIIVNLTQIKLVKHAIKPANAYSIFLCSQIRLKMNKGKTYFYFASILSETGKKFLHSFFIASRHGGPHYSILCLVQPFNLFQDLATV